MRARADNALNSRMSACLQRLCVPRISSVAVTSRVVLYQPVLKHPGYIAGLGADTRVTLGAFSEVILATAVIGTAVTLYPIVKRQNQSVALGYFFGRLLEAALMVVGIISVLSVVTLRQDLAEAAGIDPASLTAVGRSLVAIHDWTFLFGPALVLGVNTLLLAYLMYRSGLVPRFSAVLGIVGGPLIFASPTAVMFGLYEQVSVWGTIAAIPVFAWEMSLAVWLIAKGFKPSPIASGNRRQLGPYASISAASESPSRGRSLPARDQRRHRQHSAAWQGVVRGPPFTLRPARRSGLRGSGGTAGIPHSSQQGSNGNGKTANPRATARRRRRARRRLRLG